MSRQTSLNMNMEEKVPDMFSGQSAGRSVTEIDKSTIQQKMEPSVATLIFLLPERLPDSKVHRRRGNLLDSNITAACRTSWIKTPVGPSGP
jgi:hypothetical protein